MTYKKKASAMRSLHWTLCRLRTGCRVPLVGD